MGTPAESAPVLLILAAISRHDAALDWAKERAESAWGPAALVSAAFEFSETDYYRDSMGPSLKKQFLAFEKFVGAERLAQFKLQTNQWEAEFAATAQHIEPRPLNLDPGYITLAKLVLASTKDHSHRIYLGTGIFAEVTLHFRAGEWQASSWTYPDYRRADFQQFFVECRDYLKQHCGEAAKPYGQANR